MELRLLPAVKADVPELVNIYFTTFQSPIVLALLPDVPSIRKWYGKGISEDFDEPWSHVYKVVTSGDDEKIIAFGRWTAPHEEVASEQLRQYPEEGNREMFEQVMKIAGEKGKQVVGDEKSWCQSIFPYLQLPSRETREQSRTNVQDRHQRSCDASRAPAEGRRVSANDTDVQASGRGGAARVCRVVAARKGHVREIWVRDEGHVHDHDQRRAVC